MLKETSISAAFPLVEGLESAGIKLNVVPGTPLEALAAACYTPEVDLTGIDTQVKESSLAAVTSGANYADGSNEHSLAMEEIVELGASTVRVMMHHARNVFYPMVKDLVDRTNQYFEDLRTGAVKLNIVMNYPENIMDNQILIDMVERYENHFDTKPLIRSGMYPDLDGVELMELLKTGIDRIDEDVAEYLESKPADYLKKHYDAGFLLKGLENEESPDPVLVYLAARKFMDETPDSNVDLATFNNVTAAIMASAGKAIFKNHQTHTNRNKRDILFDRVSRTLNDPEPTYVNGAVYKRWLADGGSPEIIMGMIVVGDNNLSYSSLLEKKEFYLQEYKKACRLAQIRMDADKVTQILKSLQKAFHDVIREGDDSFVGTPQDQRALLDKFMENAVVTASTDLHKLVRAATYEVFYGHTQSLKIVKEIDAVCHNNKDLSTREAGTLVFIDLVTDWLDSQIKLEF
jgi:hypothetical protein